MANLDVSMDLFVNDLVFDFTIDSGGGGAELPPYTGKYEVQPRLTEQILKTKNKSMLDDVTVFQIPFKEVSNPEGGTTVTIGLE